MKRNTVKKLSIVMIALVALFPIIAFADLFDPSFLGTGTADNSHYLRGDQVWSTITSGTVTSVGATGPSSFFTWSSTPVTSSGTLTAALNTQSANLIFSGPSSGGAATPTFRSLVSDDIPSLNISKVNAGLLPLSQGGLNANLTASNGGIFYSTASAGAILAGTATAGQILRSGASTAPTWSTTTYPATSTTGGLLYASATNIYSSLSVGSSNQVLTVSGGIPVWTTWSTGLPAAATSNNTLRDTGSTWSSVNNFTNDGTNVFNTTAGSNKPIFKGQNSNGSVASPTASTQDNILGGFGAAGFENAAYTEGLQVFGVAQGTWSSTNRGAYFSFRQTDQNSVAAPTERARWVNGKFGFGAGLTNPLTTLSTNGGVSVGRVAKTANYTATSADFLILVSPPDTTTVTITLPANTQDGQILHIKKVNAGTGAVVSIAAPSGNIDGSATLTLSTQYKSYTVYCNGTQWYILTST